MFLHELQLISFTFFLSWRQSFAVCCSLSQCVAVYSSVLQSVAVCCRVMQCDIVCCSVLQCAAVCCSVLQCAAVCCSVLQCVARCCSVLQCVAVCCSVLQLFSTVPIGVSFFWTHKYKWHLSSFVIRDKISFVGVAHIMRGGRSCSWALYRSSPSSETANYKWHQKSKRVGDDWLMTNEFLF